MIGYCITPGEVVAVVVVVVIVVVVVVIVSRHRDAHAHWRFQLSVYPPAQFSEVRQDRQHFSLTLQGRGCGGQGGVGLISLAGSITDNTDKLRRVYRGSLPCCYLSTCLR